MILLVKQHIIYKVNTPQPGGGGYDMTNFCCLFEGPFNVEFNVVLFFGISFFVLEKFDVFALCKLAI